MGRRLRAHLQDLVDRLAALKKAGTGTPEVEAAIDVLMPDLLLHWRKESERVISEIERRNRDAFNRDTVVAVLASLMLRLEVLPVRSETAIDEIVATLFLEGQRAAGLEGDALAPFLDRLDAPAAARDDLRLALHGKSLEARQAVARALRAQIVQIDSPAAARVALRMTLQEALGADGAWLASAVSNWAYRWYGAAVAAAADAQGFTRLRAVNNPPFGPDQRTTPFCVYAHNREILGGTASVLGTFAQYAEAIRAGDWIAVQDVLPFSSEAPPAGTPLTTPPPYHHNCRTVPEIIR
jgi:hypothetical protein